MPTYKFLTVPQPFVSDYLGALKSYFGTYQTSVGTFFYVNFTTLIALKRGSPTYPATYGFSDVLAVYDRFFAGDGSVNLKAFHNFISRAGIDEGNRYAHQGASYRLQTDIFEAKLASPEPRGRKAVVPSLDWLQKALVKQMKELGKRQIVEATRLLPAYLDEIESLLEQRLTQSDIAKILSNKSLRPISQVDVSRFLKKVGDVREEFESRKRRAAMTLAMAEHYIDEQELRRSLRLLPRRSNIN